MFEEELPPKEKPTKNIGRYKAAALEGNQSATDQEGRAKK